jgi:hypothetical protein
MPIHRGMVQRKGKHFGFYQYGGQKKYAYKPGSEVSRKSAYGKALLQAKAIRSSQARRR